MSDLGRNLIALFVVIILTVSSPWWTMAFYMLGSSVYGKIEEKIYAPSHDFNSERWKSGHKKYRHSVLNHVATEVIKPNMSELEVANLLGNPDSVTKDKNWQYDTDIPGWRLIDWTGGGLIIHFDEGRQVKRAEINSWID